ncbi:MAG: PepSY-like domain-containing protein [Bacteroides sp.]|nr:PepSY-like domain-containing protein [Bacteroides sp.]
MMKIRVLAMMFIAALAFSACSDDDDKDHVKVPEALTQALKTKYPAAGDVDWEQKGSYYVADCMVDGKDLDVWFNAQAEWRLTEIDLNWDNVPGTVQTAFSGSEYATWKRDDIDLLEYPNQPSIYVIEVEKGKTEYQLFYSEEGNLMQTKDVTGKDDTHWPID